MGILRSGLRRIDVFLPRAAVLLAAACGALATAGCGGPAPAKAPPPPPKVVVQKPVEREVVDFADFTGRTQAQFAVDVRPRVTGYITKMPFVEGSEVKKGALLFEIDPRPYQAQLDKAQGDVVLNEARLKLAKADDARAKNIAAMNAGAISKQDLDKYQAAEEEAAATLAASKAGLESYRINLDFCQVTSPIDGRVSRYNFTIGNLANADQTLLTTVVSQDPIYVYFDVDELTLLQVVRKLMAGKVKPMDSETLPVLMALGDEKGYPHEGKLNFADNVVNASTGTLTLRGAFSNPDSESHRRLLRPGMFVRVRLPIGRPYRAVLVAQQALGTDQGRKYLYVVDDKNVVSYRPVKLGPLQEDGMQVIEEGLEPGETVVVSGLQLVRPGMKVEPVLEEAKPSEGKAAPSAAKSGSAPAEGTKPAATAADEPTKAKPAETSPAPAKAAETKAAETKAEQSEAEQPKAEQPKAEQPKAEQPKAAPVQAEPPKEPEKEKTPQ